jgi:hypothetical protein
MNAPTHKEVKDLRASERGLRGSVQEFGCSAKVLGDLCISFRRKNILYLSPSLSL